MKVAFRDQGIAKADRVNQDLGQSACSSDKPPSEAVAKWISLLATPRMLRIQSCF